MCNVIHSFYSHKCSEFEVFMQSCYFILSSIYANDIGLPITLYSDYEFGQCVQKAPYKKINGIFNDHKNYSKIDPLVWAWPKFLSLDVCSRDTIHIDGDVFLKSGFDKSSLEFTDCDVICQHLELWEHSKCFQTSWVESFTSIKHFEFPEEIIKDVPKCMFNNGVLGVKNKQLWEKYKEYYWQMVSQATSGSIDPIGWCVPDIIFEQYFLTQLCENKYKVKCILNGEKSEDITKDAIEKKYQHICADKKRDLKRCINLIKVKNTHCFDMIKSLWFDRFPEYFEYTKNTQP